MNTIIIRFQGLCRRNTEFGKRHFAPIWTNRGLHQAQSFIEELLGSENSLNFTMKLMKIF